MGAASRYITIDNPNIAVMTASQANPAYVQYDHPIVSRRDLHEKGVMSVEAKDMYLPNFSLRMTQGVFSYDAVLFNESGRSTDHLGSCLFLRGSLKSVLPKFRNTVVSQCRTQNFKFDPHNEYQHIIPAHDPFQLVHFSFKPDYVHQFLPENERWADILREKLDRKERILGNRVSPITLLQDQALKNILNCPLSGKLGLMMIETSITQIVLLQLNTLFNHERDYGNGMDKRETEIVRELRDHLQKNFLLDLSMNCLSKFAGVNSNKLMIMFKKVFGKSIFEFIGELRMEHARALLMEKDVLVNEVASAIGYKNPNHFSAAFKKKFGIRPTELRN